MAQSGLQHRAVKLTLHVGTAKTGTSSLQAALHGHPKVLQRAGFVYPRPPKAKNNHNILSVLCQSEDRFAREFFQRGDTPAAVRQTADMAWASILKQIRTAKASRVILSGEYFYGLNADEAGRLGDLLRPEFDEIELVAYVRDPASYYLSLIQQRSRGAAGLWAPSSFDMRARRCLPRLIEATGARAVVRPFAREALLGGDVVTDFCRSVLELDDETIGQLGIEEQNVSMSAEAMCLMQQLRRHVFPDIEGHFTPSGNRIMSRLRELRDELPQTTPALRAEISAGLIRSHRRDLEYLDSTFGVTFPDATRALPKDAPDPPGWDSGDLLDLLDIDRDSVDRCAMRLLADFAG